MEQTCGRGLSVLGGGKFGAALGVVLTVIVDAGNKHQNGQLSGEAYCWKGGLLCGSGIWGKGGTGGAGLAPATRERCSPESSALLAALLPTLAPAVVELDMLEARDTLWPESFITMARHRQKTPPVTDERARLATARETRKVAAGRFAGCWPSCKLRAVTGVYFWRGGRNQSNGGAETASLSTTEKRRVTEQKKYLEITRLGGEARSREQHKHPKRRFAHRTAAWASLRSNGEAETKDAARAGRTEGEGRGLATDERRKGTPESPTMRRHSVVTVRSSLSCCAR